MSVFAFVCLCQGLAPFANIINVVCIVLYIVYVIVINMDNNQYLV